MNPINIELKSQINTTDDGLFSTEPAFDKKNSLVYKGIASNMTIDSGEGILSTTGKNLKIDGNSIVAGEQSFSIPVDRWTIQDSGSKSIGKDEVCISGIVAGSTNDYCYIEEEGNNTKINFSISTDSSTKTWTSTLYNKCGFTFCKCNSTQLQLIVVVKSTSGWSTIFNKSVSIGDRKFGDKLSSGYYTTKTGTVLWAIGFDDDDYRRRYCLIITDNNHIDLVRGFGCLSANGYLTGEPVLRQRYRGGPQSIPTVELYKTLPLFELKHSPDVLLGGDTPVFTASGPSLDNSNYKVLNNGVISTWTGWVNPNYTSDTISKGTNFLKLICDENAGLGESLSEASGQMDKSGLNEWHWKIHSQFGTWDGSCPKGQEYKEESSEFQHIYGWKKINCPSDGDRYLYQIDSPYTDINGGNPDAGYCLNEPYSMGWEWMYAINLTYQSGSVIGQALTHTLAKSYNSIAYSNKSSTSGEHKVTMFGDFSYIFDSMKSYSNTTDFDSIFPALRCFFNNASSRGKYWDYGPGWCSFYEYSFTWSKYNKEIIVKSYPLLINRYDFGASQSAWVNGSNTFRYKTELKSAAESDASYPSKLSTVLEPLGRIKNVGIYPPTNNTTYKWFPDYLKVYSEEWTTSGDTKHPEYNHWIQASTNDYSIQVSVSPARLLKIKGNGQGLEEQTFNFTGLGDNSILPVLNYSINITPDKKASYNESSGVYSNEDFLRLGIYNNLGIAITFKGSLIFNAADLENKFHIYKDGEDYIVSIYNDRKSQWCRIKKGGDVSIDKITDYMFRVNICGDNNLLIESRDGTFDLEKGFNGFLGEYQVNVEDMEISLPPAESTSNNVLYYAQGINSDMDNNETVPSFLLPASTIPSYIQATDIDYFEDRVLKNKNCFLKNRYRVGNWDNKVDVYYTSSQSTTDVTYKETDIMPIEKNTYEGRTGIQTFNPDKDGTTYWIDGSTVIYPVAIASQISGINYATSTIDLPGNYAVRFYNQNNKTWAVYNQNSQVYFGNNIFTIMGSNYYFDGQGIYYLGSEKSGGNQQYSDNILIAYAIGMKYLCNAPSEAYFYSPFDRCLYIFTSSNTMQKSNSLSRFGDVLDACYCPVNQSLYMLFDGKLVIKTQDDMAIMDVEGNSLQTTSNGVQVIKDNTSYEIHSPYLYEELVPLDIETEWLGNTQALNKYTYADVVFFGEGDVKVTVDIQTIAGTKITNEPKTITIKSKDWNNNFYRLRLSPKEPVGNAFRISIKSDDKVGLYTLSICMEQASVKNAANGAR